MNSQNGMTEDLRKEVLGYINDNRELIAETALMLANTYAPLGYEQAASDAVSHWYEEHRISAFQQEVAPERSNVIARIPGNGIRPEHHLQCPSRYRSQWSRNMTV